MKSIEELNALCERMQEKVNRREGPSTKTRVVVGYATCGIAAGARPVYEAIKAAIAEKKLENVSVCKTGCVGVCRLEPLVEVYQPGKGRVTYVRMTPEKVKRVVDEHLAGGRVVDEYVIGAAE